MVAWRRLTVSAVALVFLAVSFVLLLEIRKPNQKHPPSLGSVFARDRLHSLSGQSKHAYHLSNNSYLPAPVNTLVKREDVTITVESAICRGENVLRNLRSNEGALSPWNKIEELEDNGWAEDPLDEGDERLYHSGDLDAVFAELGVPLTSGFHIRNILQDNDFPNRYGFNTKATEAYYNTEFNTDKGLIIAQGTMSPTHIVVTDERDPANTKNKIVARIPMVSRWSDVVWVHWLDVCKKAKKDPANLEYIIRYHVITPNTQFIMEQINNANTPRGRLSLKWPGKSFHPDSREGLALLGTPHLEGIVWMLKDHHDTIKKSIDMIRIFTSGASYFILVYLK
ncbi:MAG: hypothetical protein Q9183_003874 [Haloplaca sp. 2 TL-2023]